jgi:hypothetical protein
MDDGELGFDFHLGQRLFFSTTSGSGAYKTSHQMGSVEVTSQTVQRLRVKTNHSSPAKTEVKNA